MNKKINIIYESIEGKEGSCVIEWRKGKRSKFKFPTYIKRIISHDYPSPIELPIGEEFLLPEIIDD